MKKPMSSFHVRTGHQSTTRGSIRRDATRALLFFVIAALLASCASGPGSLYVRVRNHAAHNLRVQPLNGGSAGREEVVQPGAFAQAHASAVIVHAPVASIRLSVTPALVSDDTGKGYKYAHLTLRGVGHSGVIFEVMVDNENRAWIHTRDGERVAFPLDGRDDT
jgi:hypothetical protein